jgi:hypothetical protein
MSHLHFSLWPLWFKKVFSVYSCIPSACSEVHEIRPFYWMSMIAACQNAAFWTPGLTMVTWQVYSPGGSSLRDRLNLRFTALVIGSAASVTAIGGVSKALVSPR